MVMPDGDCPTRAGAQEGATVSFATDSAAPAYPAEARLAPEQIKRVCAALGDDEAPSARVGLYRLDRMIGQGGMGVVYLAEQEQPIRRTVALKLIKPGMDSREIIARFESERQALAMMNHRNVAKVLDAGTSDDCRPYFVMEYVPGESITAYCDKHQYTIKQRLELFIQACEAVQHAHQKAIIHRDLKPSNILVTGSNGDAEVKVIDFGVAKALTAGSERQTMFTQSGQLIGTPEYMSPEQAGSDGEAVDTRSDIYSLGVVLYELLTGALPFDPKSLRSSGVAEIQRIIREVDPPRPSTRLSSLGESAIEIARSRQTQLAALRRELRGELEWIPLKSLRKEPDHRYATASGLAEDIRNYLGNRPLVAGPESRGYRLRKLLRRRRAETIAGSLILVSLLAGIVGTTTFAVRASRQRTLAERRAHETNQVADFQARMLTDIDIQLMGKRLREDVLAEAEQTWQRSRVGQSEIANRRGELESLLAGANFSNPAIRSLDRNIFQRTLEAIDNQFADQPLVQARLLQQLAVISRDLTLLERATAAQTRALEIRQRELGADHPDTLQCVHSMGLLLAARGRWDQAEPYARQVLQKSQRLLGDNDRLTLNSKKLLAEVLQRQGRLLEAEPYRRETMEGFRRVLGDDARETLDAVLKLGQVLRWQDRLPEAEVYIKQAVQGMRRVLGENHQWTLRAMGVMGGLRLAQGRLPEAEALFRQAYEGIRPAVGDDNRETLFWVLQIGSALRMQGRLAEAEPYLKRAAEGLHRALGDEYRDTLAAIEELGLLRQAEGRLSEAEAYFRQALAGFRRVRSSEDLDLLDSITDLGCLLNAQQTYSEAEPLFAELYEKAGRAKIGAKAAARYMSHHGPCQVKLGRYEQAGPPLREAYRRLKETGQEKQERMGAVIAALAEFCEKTSRAEEAARWRAELAEWRATTQPSTAPAQ